MRHIPWPSIEQFKNVVRNVQHRAAYVGKDENGEAIFDKRNRSPKLKFEGTVKLHGTNAAVAMDKDGVMWCQSRSNIITPQDDNAGFAMFVKSKEDYFKSLLVVARGISKCYDADILIFGEWCGGNIQKNVAITELPRMFVIFGIAIAYKADTSDKMYFTRQEILDVCDNARQFVSRPHQQSQELSSGIYCIYDFPTFSIEIDFDNPHEKQNILIQMTDEVGAECPVAKAFGVSGIGEGIVWRCTEEGYNDSGYWFKVKDELHSKSKVKILPTVDVEKFNNMKALAERLAHNGRLEQMHQSVFNTLNGGETDIKKMGDFIKAVMGDIFKEDVDIIAASGFDGKAISGPISKICRDFIMEKLNQS